MLNPRVNGKLKDFSRPLNVFQVLFKANLIFKQFSSEPKACVAKSHWTIELQRFTEIVSYRDTFSDDMVIVS